MNKMMIGLIASLIACSHVWADEEAHLYAGLAFGQSESDSFCDDSVGSCDDSDSSMSLALGYQLTDVLATELSYIDMGEFSIDGTGVLNGTSVEAEAQAFALSVMGLYPLTERVGIYARGGIAFSDVDVSSKGLGQMSDSESGTGFLLGAGARIRMTRAMEVRAEYQLYSDVGDGDLEDDVSVITLGAYLHF